MVKIEYLFSEGKISRIGEIELEKYTDFLLNSYKDNLDHAKATIFSFPRWSIISGYYAMHDIAKLFLAKQFRIKIEREVHATTIKVLRELIKNKEIIKLIEIGYNTFLSLANDLEEAKKERAKVQYYTGTRFMHEEYEKKALSFYENIVIKYIKKIQVLLKK
ncbi:MAG: hypothetical protein ACPLXC_02215 [Candidatus Pacearchaeota archaeon]